MALDPSIKNGLITAINNAVARIVADAGLSQA